MTAKEDCIFRRSISNGIFLFTSFLFKGDWYFELDNFNGDDTLKRNVHQRD